MRLDEILLLILTVVIVIFPIAYSYIKGVPDLLSPPAIFSFGYAASYPLKGWLLYFDTDTFVTYQDIYSYDQKMFIWSNFLSIFGLVCFFLGYYRKALAISFLPLRLTIQGIRVAYILAGLACIFALGSILFLMSLISPVLLYEIAVLGNEHSSSILRELILSKTNDFSVLYLFPVYAGFFGLTVVHAKNSVNLKPGASMARNGLLSAIIFSRYFYFFMLVGTFFSLTILGSRQLLLTFVLSLILYRHYYRKKISQQTQLIFLTALVLLGGYIGITQKTRDSEVAKALEMPFPKNILFRLSSSYEQQELFENALVKDPPLELGRTIVEDVFVNYIPRVIWPSKPKVFGYLRAQNLIFPDNYWRFAGDTTYPVGVLAELYLNFGYVGIPLGMLFLGWLLRTMEVKSIFPDSLWRVIFLTMISQFISPHRTFGTILMVIFMYVLFCKVVEMLAARKA